MNRCIRLSMVVFALWNFFSCGKEEESFKTAEGKWTYTTPDGKIGVDFELVNGSSGWDISSQAIRVDGVTYHAEKQVTGLTPPALQFIRINANDTGAVYAYNIVFNDGVVNSLNTVITVQDATYTWPHNQTNNLEDITIVRK